MKTDYFKSLEYHKNKLVNHLSYRGIDINYLKFGGPGDIKRIFVPTDARSEFLANRAMGDWAEQLLTQTVNKTVSGYRVIRYGNSENISAGDPNFKDFYVKRMEDVRLFGKRPDILIISDSYDGPDDVSLEPTSKLVNLVSASLAAVEVRSSKFEALHYAKTRAEDRLTGKSASRDSQSFTVKVEDLKIVYRWIEKFQKPQIYCQVFFDSMFAINFLKIFEIIGSGYGFQIETPAKSQEKATIMIPITSGKQIAHYTNIPHFEVEHHVTRLGRHDAYVRPVGGDVVFYPKEFLHVLLGGNERPPLQLF